MKVTGAEHPRWNLTLLEYRFNSVVGEMWSSPSHDIGATGCGPLPIHPLPSFSCLSPQSPSLSLSLFSVPSFRFLPPDLLLSPLFPSQCSYLLVYRWSPPPSYSTPRVTFFLITVKHFQCHLAYNIITKRYNLEFPYFLKTILRRFSCIILVKFH